MLFFADTMPKCLFLTIDKGKDTTAFHAEDRLLAKPVWSPVGFLHERQDEQHCSEPCSADPALAVALAFLSPTCTGRAEVCL